MDFTLDGKGCFVGLQMGFLSIGIVRLLGETELVEIQRLSGHTIRFFHIDFIFLFTVHAQITFNLLGLP